MKHKIEPLEREKWQGHVLNFHYFADNYYDVKTETTDGNFSVRFTKTPFEKRFEHIPHRDCPDRLFQPHYEDIMAWGIIENGQLVAVIETSVEKWNNRLRVTELWIEEQFRRMGIGTALMNIAKEHASSEGCRAVVLETQSCNEPAINFYLAQGFKLIGFDICAYSNNDAEKKEVRLEFGYFG